MEAKVLPEHIHKIQKFFKDEESEELFCPELRLALGGHFFEALCGYLAASVPVYCSSLMRTFENIDFEHDGPVEEPLIILKEGNNEEAYWALFCQMLNLMPETKEDILKLLERVDKLLGLRTQLDKIVLNRFHSSGEECVTVHTKEIERLLDLASRK